MSATPSYKNCGSLLFALGLLGIMLFSGCQQACHLGVGEIVSQEINLSPMHGLDLQFDADLRIKKADVQSVTISGQQNVIERLNKEMDNGVWHILPTEGCLRPSENVSIEVALPTLRTLILNEDKNIFVTEPFFGMETFEAHIYKSGSIIMTGDAVNAKIINSGSGNFASFDFEVENAEIELNGSGEVEITVLESLRVTINGSGNLRVKGNPSTIVPIINGTGRVINL